MSTLEQRQIYFRKIFPLAQKKFDKSTYRLAGEGWAHVWQTLVATIMSAQTRDETTIPVAEKLFKKYSTLESLARADVKDVRAIIGAVNYCNTKAKHIVETSQLLIEKYNFIVPDKLEELVTLPGVGRKTANLIVAECYNKDGICVDTHVHRISNVLGFVQTKNPTETEIELMKVAPKKMWKHINRVFVLWGKEVLGYNEHDFLEALQTKLKR